MVENEENKERQRKTKEKVEALAMAMKTVLKQPEKNAQRDPGEKGWACYCCKKEGHLKRHCPQASKPPLAPCPVCKGPLSGLRGLTLKTIRTEGAWGSPHKLPS